MSSKNGLYVRSVLVESVWRVETEAMGGRESIIQSMGGNDRSMCRHRLYIWYRKIIDPKRPIGNC